MLPAWADILILAALPVVLGAVLWKWGGGEPDNTIHHTQEGRDRDDDPDMTAA